MSNAASESPPSEDCGVYTNEGITTDEEYLSGATTGATHSGHFLW